MWWLTSPAETLSLAELAFTACGFSFTDPTGDQPLPWMQGLAFIGIDRLIEKCREVFFATEEFSEEAFVIANGGLYFVLADYMLMDPDQAMKETYRKCMNTTRANLEYGLAGISFLMPANADTIAAFSLGAMHAIDISKPSYALTLTSAASHLCRTLGYHRESSMEHDSESERQNKLALFWTVYCIDKALSLRLGRAATIQDYDVSVPMVINIPGIVEPWNTIYHLWIQYARAQGRVYEMLYSPMAFNQTENYRASQARQLALELQSIVMKPHKAIDRQSLSLYDSLQLRADEVAHLALLTMIYRAIPAPDGTPGSFISDCIVTARTALERHQQSMDMLKSQSESEIILSYLHWIILYSPFAPFIVLFCHVVESGSTADLQQLEGFVTSLLPPNGVFSEAISRLHRLCQLLTNIARIYLEAKMMPQTEEGQIMGREFDSYLNALGLAPTNIGGYDMQPSTASNPAAASGSTSSMHGINAPVGAPLALHNRFSGNQYMMGLLEEDMSVFDMPGR